MASLHTVPRSPSEASPSDGGGDAPIKRSRRRSARATRAGFQVVGVVIALVAWHFYAKGPGEKVNLPTPWMVVKRLGQLAQHGEYWSSIGHTTLTALIGLAISIALGVPMGLIVGSSQRISMSAQFVVDFARTIPPIAIVPLLLVIPGWGGSMKSALVLILFGALWPLLVQASYAVQQLDPQLKQVATAFHLTRSQKILNIHVPSAMPFMMTGLRIAATLALLLAIVAGFFGGVPGIGRDLYESLDVSASTDMFVYAVTTAVMGMVLNALLLLLQSKVLWWHPSVRGDQR